MFRKWKRVLLQGSAYVGAVWVCWIQRPILMLAAQKGMTEEEMNAAYKSQMEQKFPIKSDTIESVNWLLLLGGVVSSVLAIVALVYWVTQFKLRLLQISLGRAALKDARFWTRMGLALVIIFSFISGAVFLLLSGWYDLTRV
ncbi:hypothetical protein [Paenibacillus sp. y28]|uniref:hypothetical protein n=1 Tax=Paenibacillus sp. y28 TaxID=3129110 RepID=UPI00301A57A1